MMRSSIGTDQACRLEDAVVSEQSVVTLFIGRGRNEQEEKSGSRPPRGVQLSSTTMIISPYPPPVDGIGHHSRDLANGFQSLGHHVEILAPRRRSEPELSQEGDRQIRRMLNPYLAKKQSTIALFDQVCPTLIVVQFTVPSLHACIPATLNIMEEAQKRGVPVVTIFHEAVREIRRFGPPGRHLYRSVLSKTTLPVTLSDDAQFVMHALDSRSVQLFHGIRNLAPVTETSRAAIDKLFGGPGTVVLTMGFIHPRKGTDLLLEAAPAIFARLPPSARLIIAGSRKPQIPILRVLELSDTRYQEKIEALAKPLEKSGKVLRVPFIEESMISAALARASVFVLPYTDITQSGIAGLCLAGGCPVVANDLPGLHQLGGAAIYVDAHRPEELGEAIADVVGNQDKRAELLAAATKIRQNESFPALARSILRHLSLP
jgi:glycosyltransferase involved in cell wall biosynthesis